MAEYEIQYLDVINKMNLEPDDLEGVFKIDAHYTAVSVSVSVSVSVLLRIVLKT